MIKNKTAHTTTGKRQKKTEKRIKSKKTQKNDVTLNQDYLGVSKENPLS